MLRILIEVCLSAIRRMLGDQQNIALAGHEPIGPIFLLLFIGKMIQVRLGELPGIGTAIAVDLNVSQGMTISGGGGADNDHNNLYACSVHSIKLPEPQGRIAFQPGAFHIIPASAAIAFAVAPVVEG
jgi:hypothetical protein